MTADKVTLDFNRRLICFTNGFSTADPEPVARAIGPKTGRRWRRIIFCSRRRRG